MSDYYGDDIVIEEMPQGCVISAVGKDGNKWAEYNIVVSSAKDAKALIDSLERMLEVQLGAE